LRHPKRTNEYGSLHHPAGTGGKPQGRHARHFDWNRGYFKPVTGFVTRCGLCYPNTPLVSRFRSS
jgi:hypothetical protein